MHKKLILEATANTYGQFNCISTSPLWEIHRQHTRLVEERLGQ